MECNVALKGSSIIGKEYEQQKSFNEGSHTVDS